MANWYKGNLETTPIYMFRLHPVSLTLCFKRKKLTFNNKISKLSEVVFYFASLQYREKLLKYSEAM